MTTLPGNSSNQIEGPLGLVLQVGVICAACIVLVGGVIYLNHHGNEAVQYNVFKGEPDELRTLWGIVHSVSEGRGRGIIQLGLLVLIATPIARVVFSAFSFFRQRDFLYVFLTLTVLGIILFGLSSHHH